MAEEDTKITLEQAMLVDQKVNEYFAYARDCYDQARREGNNVLQWLFGVTTGAIAALGVLITSDEPSITFGVLCAAGYAVFAACRLLVCLKSHDTPPPGNFARNLNTMISDSAERMRWREAIGIDQRIEKTLGQVSALSSAVDSARHRLAVVPAVFLMGAFAAWLSANFACLAILWA